jgi:hypothetical protein
MKKLIYLTVVALLGIAFTLAQNTQSTKPSSDASNSSNVSSQAPASSQADDQDQAPSPQQLKKPGESKQAVPDPTVRDQQGKTPSTTGASGSNAQPSPSTMGTTGSTPAEPVQPSTSPQNATPPDQQPNSTTGPASASPHAELMQTPAARAMRTHTPDPGTCMNPAALETATEGSQQPQQPCR